MPKINNYDPNPYDNVTIDEALAQIYDRVNDRTIRQIVTLLKKVIDGSSAGDTSRYTVEKTTAESGEVTYKLMQQINNGTPTPVGDTVGLRGSQILANYDEELQILDNIISIIKVALDGKADTTDIPTVPIMAIQKNGTGITPVDGTVNITVPVVAADVAALPDNTRYAAALSLTIDSATFIVTGQLKDQNGDNLGTAQTIDLPLESVVVGGSYNSQTQKVVLTLQNGNTIEFSVADLVYGLQTELSETNKLNPAYINYDNTHRAVSDAEKSTWNGKQDAIDSSHKLSADFVDDTNATNKFATAAQLDQIETNKNNISLKANTSDVNTATASLQAQIDEIVTPVTQDAEVQVARAGYDGRSYASLKSRLDAEATDFNNSIVAINSHLGTNCLIVANASFSGTTGGLPDGTSTNRIRTDNIPIKKGDKVYINGKELKHAVGMWEGTISASSCVRNDNGWRAEPETVTANKDGYICIVFANSNDTALKKTDFRGEAVVFPYYATGEDVEIIEKTILIEDIDEVSPEWKMGYLSSADGRPMSSTSGSYYILSNYISAKGIAKITTRCSSDFRVKLFGYNESLEALKAEYNFFAGDKKWDIIGASYYRVGIMRAQEAIINPDTINLNVAISKTPYLADLYDRSNVLDYPVVSQDIKNNININSNIARYNALFNNCGSKIESLLFFSDPHIYKNTSYPNHTKLLAEIQKAYNMTPASLVVCGGDWLMDGDTQEQACNKLAYIKGICDNVFRDRILNCIGNHDTNYQGVDGEGTANAGKLSANTLDALWFNEYGKSYYKYQGVNTAFYVLDTGTDWETVITDYREEQLVWLANAIKNETGNIAIIMHIYNNLNETTPFAVEVGKIITANNTHGDYGIGEEVIDFTASTGTIKFVLTGHEHKDFETTISNVPVVGIINAMNSEQISFDMIFVDYDNNSLKCIRSGLGSDRTYTLA